MAYANVRVTATQTGDAAEKQLVERKEILTGEVAALGLKIEEAESYIERISLAEAECAQVEEELETLRTEESELLKRIDELTERADEQRIKGDELETNTEKLMVVHSKIVTAEEKLKQVNELIRLAEINLQTTKASADEQIQKLKDIIAVLESEVVAKDAELNTIRTNIERTNAAFVARSTEFKSLEKEYGLLKDSVDDLKHAQQVVTDSITTAKHELGVIELELSEKRAAHTSWANGVKAELDAREIALASREGALSDRASMLDVRARKLREAKARLENHFGTRMSDLIIE